MNEPENRIKILAVDDERDIREGCERILTRLDFHVFTASRGEEALAIVQKENIAIVLLDLKMPGMDGIEVLHRIREFNQNIVVIVVTGFATVATAIEAMKKGAYDFIPKPFEPEQLRIVVKRAREKLRLEYEAEKLKQERARTLADLGMEKSRIRTIIESLPNGIVVTNTACQVVLINPIFCKYLGFDLKPGESIDHYIKDETLCTLIQRLSQNTMEANEKKFKYELQLDNHVYLLAEGQQVLSEDGDCLGAVVMFMDITEMKALNQMKSDFVAKVSHDLRSPLTTIHEQLSTVLNDMEGLKEYYVRILTRAKEKTHGLITMIADLLDISRIEAGMVHHRLEPVNINNVLKSIIEFLDTQAKHKQQTLIFQPNTESLPEIIADMESLDSIFGNLISNAINYTQEGGEIIVKSSIVQDHICVEVKDNGYGIESQYHEKIFDKFFRVKNEKTRYAIGTGLGLPIVKALVEGMKGQISLESDYGKGSSFLVKLPINSPK
ncbi:MAG: response regulator [Desulfobacterales bacterium]|nr:response regulator [Desulfobacterales bacterium]